MTTTYRIGLYLAIALIVVTGGGLLGWYYFVQERINSTEAESAARGLGAAPSFGGTGGSGFQNAAGSLLQEATTVPAGEVRAAPRLWRVAQNPVAGFAFASSSPRALFVEISSGNVLEADPLTSGVSRRTNTLLPKAFDAAFSSEGSVLLRFAESGVIRTYSGSMLTASSTVQATSTPGRLSGVYLTGEILAIAPAAKDTLISLVRESTGASVVQSSWQGSGQKKIVTLPLRDWRLLVAEDGAIVVSQKASDGVSGAAYVLSASGALTPIVENVPGLVVNPKSRTVSLYSSDGALFVKTPSGISALPISTSAEKCVWARGVSLVAYCAVPRISLGTRAIQDRYQGLSHSSDSWYRIDIAAGTAEEFFAPDTSASIDVESPQIDASNRYIAFTNAADKSFWLFRIAP